MTFKNKNTRNLSFPNERYDYSIPDGKYTDIAIIFVFIKYKKSLKYCFHVYVVLYTPHTLGFYLQARLCAI